MTPTEFARRRRQLMRMIGSGGIAILPAAPEKIRNRDTIYPFRQDSDFIYLSGFDEPDAVAVLIPGRAHAEYILFCRERDPSRETWDGPRAGPEGAQADHGADDAFPISDIDEILPGLMEHCDRVYYTMGAHPDFDTQVMGWFDGLRNRGQGDGLMPQEFIALDHLLHDMRLYKSRGEIGAMRKAARIAAAAHKKLMAACRPGIMEYELEAELLHEFKRNGCETAYQPIVGSGPNSCVLHYVKNDRRMEDGEMLLVDAGCEYRGYASDVTRSMPVNGRFSSEQKAIYQIVLDAQKAAIEKVSPRCHWNEPHDAAVRTITRGLVKLGLLKGRVPALIKATAYKKFFMHRTGHWLGMDVHDVGDYRVGDEWRHLEPGMVMTVEPGIYIPPGIKGVAKKWWGIGVRIEDDILVTKDGCEVLSRDVPREIADIEALMNGEI
ncbi:MAG: aminopeptidase P N-terminal domain-containing protein [Gammaproteobacteria bacterium]|nr:aminopeptidase P N-terminal domain-containing protein [Gammaproteobacteria bacterium]MCZ6761571.1 aminopeptidase P N-terminal domain-containing protein [Gammaproteobacteria bacterium]